MMKMIRSVICMLCLCSILAIQSCEADSADLKQGFGSILGWLLKDVTRPENLLAIATAKGETAKGDVLVNLTLNKVGELKVKVEAAVASKSTVELDSWCAANMPEFSDYLKKYNAKKVWKFLNKIQPRLGDTLKETAPRILTVLNIQPAKTSSAVGLMSTPDIPVPIISADQVQMLTNLLVDNYKNTAPAQRSEP